MKLSSKTSINLGGKNRTLYLDMNAFSEIEGALDVNLMSNGEAFFSNLTFRKMRVLVWAMLYKERPVPSLEDVGVWLSNADMEDIGNSISKLFTIDSKGNAVSDKAKAADPTKG